MKKNWLLLLPLMVAVVSILSACNKEKNEPSDPGNETEYMLSVAEENVELMIGDTYTLSATVEPEPESKIKWTYKMDEGGEKIITLTEAGVIKAIAEGETFVRISAYLEEEDYLIKKNVRVTVSKNKAQIKLDGVVRTATDTLKLMEGKSATLTAALVVAKEVKSTIWATSNSTVATVANGKVTAGTTEGVAKITATIETTTGTKFTATIPVQVRTNLHVLNSETKEVVTGKIIEMAWKSTASFTVPTSYQKSGVKWTISDAKVAMLTPNSSKPYLCTVTACDELLDKTAVITVSAEGQTATFTVKLTPTPFKLNTEELALDVFGVDHKQSGELSINWNHLNATEAKQVTWSASNPAAIVLSSTTGTSITVTANAFTTLPIGITITAKYGKYSSYCTVRLDATENPQLQIQNPTQGIDENLHVGATGYFPYSTMKNAVVNVVKWNGSTKTYVPLDKNLTLTSLNTNVATISNHTMTINKPGTTKIHAYVNQGFSSDFNIEIVNDIAGFMLAKSNCRYTRSTKTLDFWPKSYNMAGSDNTKISNDDSNTTPWDLFGFGHLTRSQWYTTTSVSWKSESFGINGGRYLKDPVTKEYFRILEEAEWTKILKDRTNASTRRVFCRIQDGSTYVNGLLILPDYWNTSVLGISKTLSYTAKNYTTNTLTTNDLIAFEGAGARFLPAAGWRVGTQVQNLSAAGCYWTYNSSSENAESGKMLMFVAESTGTQAAIVSIKKYTGAAIRLGAKLPFNH